MITARSSGFVVVTLIWCLWGQFSKTPITLSACDLQKLISFFNFQNQCFECPCDLAHFFCSKFQIFECMHDLAYFFRKVMNVLTILITFGFRWRLLHFGVSWKWRMYAAVCLLSVLISFIASWKYRMYAAVCLLSVLMSFNASWKSWMYAAGYVFSFCSISIEFSLSWLLMLLSFAASE